MSSPSPDEPQAAQPGQGGQPGAFAGSQPPPPPGGYGPYGPGPYGYGPYYGPPPLGTNTMAILSIVFAFVVAPLGIVFGCIALSQLKSRPQEGRGLAIAGIAVGAAATVLFVLYIILMIAFFSDFVNHLPQVNPTGSA